MWWSVAIADCPIVSLNLDHMKEQDLKDFAAWLAVECELCEGVFSYEQEDYTADGITEVYTTLIKNA